MYLNRYHSFYPAHRERDDTPLINDKDRRMFDRVGKFNPCDLYTKSHERPDVKVLRPYCEDLISEFIPWKIKWQSNAPKWGVSVPRPREVLSFLVAV